MRITLLTPISGMFCYSFHAIEILGLGLIRFRGHVPKGGYDVQNGINEGRETGGDDSSVRSSGSEPFGWSWMRARRSAPSRASWI